MVSVEGEEPKVAGGGGRQIFMDLSPSFPHMRA